MKRRKDGFNSVSIFGFVAIIIVVFFSFVFVMYRASYLALSKRVEGIDLEAFSSSRITKTETIFAKRGNIYDASGKKLAQNVSSYTLIAYLSPSRTTNPERPQHVVDKELTAEKLAPILNMDKDAILKLLSKEGLYQTEFGSHGRGLTEITKDEIVALGLPGLGFIETQKRYYPYGKFLSYTLGYAKNTTVVNDDGQAEDVIVGDMGIEKYCNAELTGTNGFRYYQKDRNGYKIAGTNELKSDAIDGMDVYLTIDSNVQLFVEQALAKVEQKYKFDWMTIMLADAKTGAILASASSPSFDPNTKNIKNYLDQNISLPYEPGSTMKIFSYMAAMEAGVYDGSEKYRSGIFKAKDGTEIGDWNRNGWGYITYDQGFALSSNVAISYIIDKYMDANMLRSYYKKLGFGEKTGIELPNEASGKLNFKYQTEILNAGFGQGITTTPIQNIKALTAISNNGILLKPYIIDKIVNPNTGEVVYQGQKTELGRVASEKTVKKIKELMANVINGDWTTSTGYSYYMKGYDLIAKTGTAQVAREDGKGYSNETIRGLAGMFPGKDPQVVIYLAAKNPSNGGVTPMKSVVKDVIKNVSKYLNIYDETKQKNEPLQTYTISSYISKKTSEVVSSLRSNGMKVVVLGDGDYVVAQSISGGEEINSLDTLFLLTNTSIIKMPNLVGMSSKNAHTVLDLLGISYEIDGVGYVKSQSIKKDTVLKEDDVVKLTLELPFKEE